MDNEEIFTMQDENGVEREARILNKIEIDGQNYLIYALSMNDEEDSIYVSKIIKNGEDEEIISITDDDEREMVKSVVTELVSNL